MDNEGYFTQLDGTEDPTPVPDGEDASGRWLRERLSDPGGNSLTRDEIGDSPDDVGDDLMASLTASLSRAVADPVRLLERRRAKQAAELEQKLREHGVQVGDAVSRLQAAEERLNELQQGLDALSQLVERNSAQAEAEKQERVDSLARLHAELTKILNRLATLDSDVAEQRRNLAQLVADEQRRRAVQRGIVDALQRLGKSMLADDDDDSTSTAVIEPPEPSWAARVES